MSIIKSVEVSIGDQITGHWKTDKNGNLKEYPTYEGMSEEYVRLWWDLTGRPAKHKSEYKRALKIVRKRNSKSSVPTTQEGN